jgi:hypothetical protein
MPQDRLSQSKSSRLPVIITWAIFGLVIVALIIPVISIYTNTISEHQVGNESALAVAAAENSKNIELGPLDCLSTNKERSLIFEQIYFDNPAILDLIKEQFPGKRITSDGTDCPFGIGFNILKITTRAIRYHERPAEVLMSFYVCTQKPSGGFNASPCTSKNIYLFTNDIAPIQAFSLGLQAFIQNQETQWAIMNLSPTTK